MNWRGNRENGCPSPPRTRKGGFLTVLAPLPYSTKKTFTHSRLTFHASRFGISAFRFQRFVRWSVVPWSVVSGPFRWSVVPFLCLVFSEEAVRLAPLDSGLLRPTNPRPSSDPNVYARTLANGRGDCDVPRPHARRQVGLFQHLL